MKGHPSISSVYRQGPQNPTDDEERMADLLRRGLKKHRIVVIPLDDERLNEYEQRFAEEIGKKLTGTG